MTGWQIHPAAKIVDAVGVHESCDEVANATQKDCGHALNQNTKNADKMRKGLRLLRRTTPVW